VCSGADVDQLQLQRHAHPGEQLHLFTSVFKVDGLGSNPVTVRFDDQQIQFTAAGTPFTLDVPSASVTFSPTATLATTTFNTVTNEWETTLPSSGLAGNDFVSGLAFQVPFDFPAASIP